MFFALLIQKQIKKKKVKHTQKKFTNKKQFVILFSSTRMANGHARSSPCLNLYSQFFVIAATTVAAAIRFVLRSAPKQCDTTNDTLEYDDINDNERRWRRKNDGKNELSKQASKRQTHTHIRT